MDQEGRQTATRSREGARTQMVGHCQDSRQQNRERSEKPLQLNLQANKV